MTKTDHLKKQVKEYTTSNSLKNGIVEKIKICEQIEWLKYRMVEKEIKYLENKILKLKKIRLVETNRIVEKKIK